MSTQQDTSGQRARAADPEVMECPFGFYADLHAEGTAAYDEGPVGWVVPGYDDLVEMSKDTHTFSNELHGAKGMTLMGVSPEPYSPEVAELAERMHPMANVLFFSDPPNHTRTRVLATKALNAARIRAMEPRIHAIVDQLVDAFVDDGRCDLINQFAVPLPANLMGEVLGIDAADMKDFKRWSDHVAVGIASALGNEQRREVAQSVIEFQEYLLERVAQRRERPTDDLLSAIVHAELDLQDLRELEEAQDVTLEGPRTLTDSEIISIAFQVLSGGNHTTTDLVGASVLRLIRHPEVMEEVRADPGLVTNLLEETLRIESPVQCTYRVTTQPARLRDTDIPAGSMIGANWGAAGHDPRHFPDPNRFDIHRPNARRHLSFGHGKHFCVGSNLARAEARIAVTTLLERLEDIRLSDGAELRHDPTYAFNTLLSLPIEFRRAGV